MLDSSTPTVRRSRCEIAFLLSERAQAAAQGQSERAFCSDAGIARSTLRDAAVRDAALDVPDATRAFFTSPEGQMLLRRIVVAAHFVITLLGCGGIELVGTFLRLAGHAPFVGCSYGAQHRIHTALVEHLGAFAKHEQQRLGAAMSPKKLWLCEDETFFAKGEMVLVAIDALSNFILVERFAERRDEPTWTSVVEQALRGLNVEVLGVTADQAKGIVAHAAHGLCVPALPELFHFQHELSGGFCATLSSRVRAEERALAAVKEHGPGKGERSEAQVLEALVDACALREQFGAVLEGASDACHPYELQTGQSRSGKDVAEDLNALLDGAERVAGEAKLPEAAGAAVRKARRAVGAMAQGVEGFHTRVNLALTQMALPPPIEEAMRQRVLPALYLEAAAKRSGTSEVRTTLQERARALVAPLRDKETGALCQLSEAQVEHLLAYGQEWVSWYVRASSCVEGRNGQLSLHHHSLHGLSEAKLAALTTVHNFWSERPDGTTAAERFFGQKPQEVFEWLVDVMPELPYPAQKRPRVAPSPLLN